MDDFVRPREAEEDREMVKRNENMNAKRELEDGTTREDDDEKAIT